MPTDEFYTASAALYQAADYFQVDDLMRSIKDELGGLARSFETHIY